LEKAGGRQLENGGGYFQFRPSRADSEGRSVGRKKARPPSTFEETPPREL